VKIALDAMGGDLAPKAAVEGGVLAARDFGIEVTLVGDRAIIERELADHENIGSLPIRIEHAPEVVLMDDSPIESVFAKPNSSIHVGFDVLKRGDCDGFVSAGNSGAVMAAAMAILGNLAGVDRPAIASVVPTSHGAALLIDAGANTEVKPVNLVHFAVMGSVYWRRVRGVTRPRVGILANGEEASKGTDLTRTAAEMLERMASHINYIGYVEGRDINRGKADVVVTDGFTGNVTLKTMEGFASFMTGNLFKVFGETWRGRIAFLLVRKGLSAMRQRLDPHEYGGAPLLGVNGVAIIAHGSSNPHAIRNAIRTAANEAVVRHVNFEIAEILSDTETIMPAKRAGKGFRALFSKMRERLSRHPKEAPAPTLEPPPAAVKVEPVEPVAQLPQPAAVAPPPEEPPALAAPGKPPVESSEHPTIEITAHKTIAGDMPASSNGSAKPASTQTTDAEDMNGEQSHADKNGRSS
jgi:glycerol-3-phosphate acyltransferase PlsX